jgi:hypothetical protein
MTLLTVWEFDHAFAVALETADARWIRSANASHLQTGQPSIHGGLMSIMTYLQPAARRASYKRST